MKALVVEEWRFVPFAAREVFPARRGDRLQLFHARHGGVLRRHAAGRVLVWMERDGVGDPVAARLTGGSFTNLGGQFRFDIGGLDTGGFTIEATTNLTQWDTIHADTVPNTNFNDPDSTLLPNRVYCVTVP